MGIASVIDVHTEEDDGGSTTSAETDKTSPEALGTREDVILEDLTELLPNECLGLVFRKLEPVDSATCSLVCRRWHMIDAECRLNLSLRATVGLGSVLPKVLDRFTGVQKLVLKCERSLPSVDDHALDIIAVLCKSLRKFKLKNCKQVTDDGLENFASKCRELRKFSCGGCGFGIKGLNMLLQQCTSLEDLTVKRSMKTSTSERNIQPLQLGEMSLRRLCLKDQGSSYVWMPLLEGSKKLETLILARNGGSWDTVLQKSLGRGLMPELSQVYLERVQVSDAGLQGIAQCPKLEALVVIRAPDCTNAGITAVAKGCPSLRRLHIEGWAPNHIGDPGLAAIATYCRQLQELVLVAHACTVISLRPLASNCQNLERLTLCASPTLGDAEISCLAEGCPNLRRLCIKACEGVTDIGIIALANGCPSLQRLKVRKCQKVQSGSIEFLQKTRPEITITQERSREVEARVGEEVRDDSPFQGRERSRAPDAGSRHRFARARLAIAVGTTYVAGALRRWVGGTGQAEEGSRH